MVNVLGDKVCLKKAVVGMSPDEFEVPYKGSNHRKGWQ